MGKTDGFNIGKCKRIARGARFAVYRQRHVSGGKVRDLLTIRATTSPHGAMQLHASDAGELAWVLENVGRMTEEEGL
jgi:hypothetical protein